MRDDRELLELLLAWRIGYDAVGRGESNQFQDLELRAAWEQGRRAAAGVRLEPVPRTQEQVAAELGLSAGYVQVLERKALQKLRAKLKEAS